MVMRVVVLVLCLVLITLGRVVEELTGVSIDPAMMVESTLEIPVQVNGKLRDKITVPADASLRMSVTEHADPGGVSWTTRTPSAGRTSTSTTKPTLSR